MEKYFHPLNPLATLDEWEAIDAEQLIFTISGSFRELVACTGAKNFAYDSEKERGEVTFTVPRGYCANRAHKIAIRCTWDDLITVEFFSRSGKLVDRIPPLWCTEILAAFREHTAMQTTVPKILQSKINWNF
jgi:hypothetical protein